MPSAVWTSPSRAIRRNVCRTVAALSPLNSATAFGVSGPEVLQERLGHASIRTTFDVHGHLFDGLDEAAADSLETVFRGPMPTCISLQPGTGIEPVTSSLQEKNGQTPDRRDRLLGGQAAGCATGCDRTVSIVFGPDVHDLRAVRRWHRGAGIGKSPR